MPVQAIVAGIALVPTCLALATGCRNPTTPAPSASADGSARLALVDSIVLDEPDSAFIGRPGQLFSVDADGSILITDQYSERILRFDGKGQLRQTYGTRPGSIRRAGSVNIHVDSLLLHATEGRQLVAFDYHSGKELWHRAYRGYIVAAQMTPSEVLFGSYDPASKKGVIAVPLDSILSTDTLPLGATRVEFPDEYSRYPDLEIFNGVVFAAWQDTLVAGFAGVDYVVRYGPAGIPIDTFVVPAVARRGTPTSSLRLFGRNGGQLSEQVSSRSALFMLWRVPGGNLVIWFNDASTVEGPRNKSTEFTGVAWLSVLDLEKRRACVDAKVPEPESGLPRLAMHGDTLYSFDQLEVNAPSGRGPRSVVRRYLVDSSECTWMPLRT